MISTGTRRNRSIAYRLFTALTVPHATPTWPSCAIIVSAASLYVVNVFTFLVFLRTTPRASISRPANASQAGVSSMTGMRPASLKNSTASRSAFASAATQIAAWLARLFIAMSTWLSKASAALKPTTCPSCPFSSSKITRSQDASFANLGALCEQVATAAESHDASASV